METQTERRLAVKVAEREQTHSLLEELHREVDGGPLTDVQRKQAEMWREGLASLDEEIDTLDKQSEADKAAAEKSKSIRRAMRVAVEGVEAEDDGVVYRSMAAYARDVIMTSNGTQAGKIQAQFGDREELQRAAQRLDLLKRLPANTLSSNVAGLTPAQHIAQIFQVINDERPLVQNSQRADLIRGQLTYPLVGTKPVVAVQNTEKTEAGNTGMAISMVTTTASTYLGGGDLSWQAVNWSSPNALDLWFRFAAADYALKTEQDAAQAMQHSAFTNVISSPLSGTADFATTMTAIGAGGAKVYSVSGRIANTLYVAPDRYWYAVGLTSAANLAFGQNGLLNLNAEQTSLRVVVSRGMDAGVMVLGDRDGLLVAETPGAPVELRVVEPAIGGYEVGIIGAFEAVVVDNGAFSMITTAS